MIQSTTLLVRLRWPMVAMLLAAVTVNSPAWTIRSEHPDEMEEIIRNRLAEVIPRRWHKRYGKGATEAVLPHLYGTLKQKCFSWDAETRTTRRVCTKPGHSGLRKVVSFITWPRRKAWRRVGRALEQATKLAMPGFEAWRLKDAAPCACMGVRQDKGKDCEQSKARRGLPN